MSLLGRFRLGNAPEIVALKGAIDDLGRDHHHTAVTALGEVRTELADSRRLVDPVAMRAVREAVDAMLVLVSSAVEEAQASREVARAVEREAVLLRARLEKLESDIALLRAEVGVRVRAGLPSDGLDHSCPKS
jgi:hypothetical protein